MPFPFARGRPAIIPNVSDQRTAWEAIDGAILSAGQRVKNLSQKTSSRNVERQMARADRKLYDYFREAHPSSHARAVRISRVLHPERKERRRAEQAEKLAASSAARASKVAAQTKFERDIDHVVWYLEAVDQKRGSDLRRGRDLFAAAAIGAPLVAFFGADALPPTIVVTLLLAGLFAVVFAAMTQLELRKAARPLSTRRVQGHQGPAISGLPHK